MTAALKLREARAIMDTSTNPFAAAQFAPDDTHARFISEHSGCAVTAITDETLTVCSGWSRRYPRARWGWRIETLKNTRAAVREWLGY